MHAVVVYESMYGNTRNVAEVIALRLLSAFDVTVVPLARATPELLQSADLLVVGAPTHAHGMSRASTRNAAVEAVATDADLVLDEQAPGVGVREWFRSLPMLSGRAAAFDTRLSAPSFLTGRASRGIARELRRHGFTLVTSPKSFLVTKKNRLGVHEQARAERWGEQLVDVMTRANGSREMVRGAGRGGG